MPVSDRTAMEDKNYIGLAQLYTLMKEVTSNNPVGFEKLLQVCDYVDNLYRMIDDILERGIDINYCVRESDFFKAKMPHLIGSTALHLAAEKDDICTFDYLIKKGADFTVKNANQFTVVHQMIYKSDYKKYFDSVTFEGKLEQDPFVEFALSAHIQYQNSSNPCDKNGMSHFSVACMTNNVKAVEFFLKNGVSVNETHKEDSSSSTGYTPLHFAAKYCAVEVAEILLNRGADLTAKDSKGMTALQVLVEEKMKIWTKRTRMMSMDMSDKPETYTGLIALFEKNEKIMKMMLDCRSSKDEESSATGMDFTRFYAVCTMQNTSMVEHFLNNKVVSLDQAIDFQSPFCPGYTASHFAAHFNANRVKLLINNGANMDIKDAKGMTPLDICMRTLKVEDIYSIMQLRDDWSNITFLNGKTKLLDFIYSMQEPNLFEDYLRNEVTSMYTYVNLNSPICAGYTPLHLAVTCTETCPSNWKDRVIRMPRYFARITTCLSLGADVTAENADGLTSVHQAFRLCENQVVSHLLQCQRRIFNPVDNNGLSHFHIACVVNCKDLIEKLIKNGIDVNSSIKAGFRWYKKNSNHETFIASGSTPLHLVADVGDLAMVKLMTTHNANVFAKDADGLTAIERAIKAKPIEKNICSYSDAVRSYEEVIDLLRKLVISKATIHNLTHDFDSLLYKILHRIPHNSYTLGLFIKHDKKDYRNIIVNERMLECVFKNMGITMLHLACYDNSYEQIRKQLDNGANVNARVNEDSPFYPGYTPLHFAVLYQRLRMIDSEYMSTDIVDLLLKNGADVTIADCDRRTPIHQAFDWFSCKEYPPDIISVALLKGHKDFSINPVDNSGISHFHVACCKNKKNIVEEFINKGVNVNQTVDHFRSTFGGYTPLHFAMVCPSKKTYSLLLKHGADVNAKDRLGNTPLHVAVNCSECSNDQVFSSVLRSGADPNAKNMMHATPLEMLIDKEEVTRKAVAHFISHGARVNIVNPISREGLLSQSVSLLSWDESIFHEVSKAQDIMDVDENGSTAMHNIVSIDADWIREISNYVIEKDYFPTQAKAIEILTNFNIDIDSQDKKGMTALHLAVKNCNFECVAGLLLNGADVNAIDTSGNTPFTYSWEVHNPSAAPSSDKLKSFELKIFQILTVHVHKLLFAKIHVNKANQDIYVEARKKFYVDYKNICNAELQELGKRQIGSSLVSLRHFISETGVVASYPHIMQPQRQEIDEFFKNSVKSLHKQYPTMTSLLKLQYRKALVRAELVLSAGESLNLLLNLDLPVLCSDALMRFLTNEDLKNIIAAVNVM